MAPMTIPNILIIKVKIIETPRLGAKFPGVELGNPEILALPLAVTCTD